MTTWTQVTSSVRQAIEQARDELNRLDAAAGDGDLGLTMTAAAQGAAALAERGELDGKPLAEALRALGRELARCAPSTSGTLLARGLLQAGREAGDHADDPPVGRAAALVRAGIAGIQKAGKAQPGDRTMLDALTPLAEALQSAADRGEPPAAAAAAAAEAARAGAESTKDLEPKVGRASWIPDRARGNVDAGAHAVAIIAEAVAAAVD
jgi:dihydroxyacetone kinase-like protein